MTADRLEHPETTLVFDFKDHTVELYTTDRRAWLRAIKRNPNYLKAIDLQPGYSLLYSTKQCRDPESVLRPADGGDDAVTYFLSSLEIEQRAAAGQRLKKNRLDTTKND
jgi:hypothetical protein